MHVIRKSNKAETKSKPNFVLYISFYKTPSIFLKPIIYYNFFNIINKNIFFIMCHV